MDNRVESFIEQPKESARLVPLGENGECWGVVRADLEMEDVLSCRLVSDRQGTGSGWVRLRAADTRSDSPVTAPGPIF